MTIGPLDLALLNGALLVSYRDAGREPKMADVRAALAAEGAASQ